MSDDVTNAGKAEPSSEHQDEWVASCLQNRLDRKVEELDFNVSSKLSAARHRALSAESSNGKFGGLFGGFLPKPILLGSGVAAVLAVVVGTKLFPTMLSEPAAQPPVQAVQLTQSDLIEELNLLSAGEDLEFFEAIELLEWMESNSG